MRFTFGNKSQTQMHRDKPNASGSNSNQAFAQPNLQTSLAEIVNVLPAALLVAPLQLSPTRHDTRTTTTHTGTSYITTHGRLSRRNRTHSSWPQSLPHTPAEPHSPAGASAPVLMPLLPHALAHLALPILLCYTAAPAPCSVALLPACPLLSRETSSKAQQ